MKSKSMFLLCQQYGEAAKITGYMISFCGVFFHAEKIRVYKVFGTTVLFKTRFSLVLFPCGNWFFFNHASVYLSNTFLSVIFSDSVGCCK